MLNSELSEIFKSIQMNSELINNSPVQDYVTDVMNVEQCYVDMEDGTTLHFIDYGYKTYRKVEKILHIAFEQGKTEPDNPCDLAITIAHTQALDENHRRDETKRRAQEEIRRLFKDSYFSALRIVSEQWKTHGNH